MGLEVVGCPARLWEGDEMGRGGRTCLLLSLSLGNRKAVCEDSHQELKHPARRAESCLLRRESWRVFWILGAPNPIRFQVPDYCEYIQLVRGYSREAWGKGEPVQHLRAASEYPVRALGYSG